MKDSKSRLLLVLGCQRSGTTLLAAMLGGHSEINMLFESVSTDVNRLIGKKYNGNKLLTWRQIRKSQRASKWGHFINRITNFHFTKEDKHHKIRLFPTSQLSIDDYIQKGAKIICITRDKQEVVKSITARTQMNEKQAIQEYSNAMKDLTKLENIAHMITFDQLVKNPEESMKSICDFLNLKYESRMMQGPEYNFVYPQKEVLKDKSTTTH